jgi:hypothetical protein
MDSVYAIKILQVYSGVEIQIPLTEADKLALAPKVLDRILCRGNNLRGLIMQRRDLLEGSMPAPGEAMAAAQSKVRNLGWDIGNQREVLAEMIDALEALGFNASHFS